MEILVVISVLVSAAVVWTVPRFWTALWLSTTSSFAVWVEAAVLATHPLVTWKLSFVPASLAVSCACFLGVWLCGYLLRRFIDHYAPQEHARFDNREGE